MVKNIFFDLDSTLLQMDQDEHLKKYFNALTKFLYEKINIDPKDYIEKMNIAIYKMLKNDGNLTNEEVFKNELNKYYNISDDIYNEFYLNYYQEIFKECKNEKICDMINLLNQKGYNIVLATTPVFPRIATVKRLEAIGLNVDCFKEITTYENYSYTKPNVNYFNQILTKLNLKEEETLMVGNDMQDDFSSLPIKMKKYLIEDYMMNVKDLNELDFDHSSMDEFINKINNNYLLNL